MEFSRTAFWIVNALASNSIHENSLVGHAIVRKPCHGKNKLTYNMVVTFVFALLSNVFSSHGPPLEHM